MQRTMESQDVFSAFHNLIFVFFVLGFVAVRFPVIRRLKASPISFYPKFEGRCKESNGSRHGPLRVGAAMYRRNPANRRQLARLFRCERGYNFLKARIAAKRVTSRVAA